MKLAEMPPRAASGRLDWADIAKGLSIILLVFWHTSQFHPALGFLRMPLFFFVSGLFACQVVAHTGIRDFLKNKIGGMIYLYVLWALISIVLIRSVPTQFANPVGDIKLWMKVFWYPPRTLWFIYALAISFLIARLLSRMPFWVVFAASVLVYAACHMLAGGGSPPLPQRIGLLFPFFWVGLFVLPLADTLVTRYHRFWPPVLAVFLLAAGWQYSQDYPGAFLSAFVISWIGIAGVVLFAKSIERFALGRFLVYIGGATLYIYLMHRIFLFYMDRFTDARGWDAAGVDLAKAAILVIGCTVLGKWAHQSGLRWAFAAPWLPRRRRRIVAAQPA